MSRAMLATALLSLFAAEAAAYVSFDTFKSSSSPPTTLGKRAFFSESLINNVTGGSYMISTTVGTPGQNISLVLDTGSSDVFVVANNADQCTSTTLQRQYGPCVGGTFVMSSSSTYRLINTNFDISYADGSGSSGDYFSDTFSLSGGRSITNQQMGLALKTTVGTGIMGIGYAANEATLATYPSVIDNMMSQGLISSKAYSLWLNDLDASTGQIIFGGIDTAKYSGNLIALPIQKDAQTGAVDSFTVALSSVSVTNSGSTTTLTNSTFVAPVVLDSGTTLTYLPAALTASIYSQFGVIDETARTGEAIIDCSYQTSTATVNYSFGGSGGPTIQVPMNELVFAVGISASTRRTICGFGIQSSGNTGINLLGDTFLRSAYVVYDISANQVALAQTNFNATGSNIQNIPDSSSGIPLVSGVATSAVVSATASARPGVGRTTVVGGTTYLVAATSAAASSKAAGSHVTTPRFDWSGVMVIGVASLGAIVGGGVFVNLAL